MIIRHQAEKFTRPSQQCHVAYHSHSVSRHTHSKHPILSGQTKASYSRFNGTSPLNPLCHPKPGTDLVTAPCLVTGRFTSDRHRFTHSISAQPDVRCLCTLSLLSSVAHSLSLALVTLSRRCVWLSDLLCCEGELMSVCVRPASWAIHRCIHPNTYPCVAT